MAQLTPVTKHRIARLLDSIDKLEELVVTKEPADTDGFVEVKVAGNGVGSFPPGPANSLQSQLAGAIVPVRDAAINAVYDHIKTLQDSSRP